MTPAPRPDRRPTRTRLAGLLAAAAGLAVGAPSFVRAQDAATAVGPAAPVPAPAAPRPQQPAAQPEIGEGGQPSGDLIQIDQLSEPWELRNFVDYVAGALQINVIASDQLSGSVVINAPMEVPRADLLGLLDAMLEQHGFAIVRDDRGFYRVQSIDQVALALDGPGGPTRIIPTAGVRPSALQPLIMSQLLGPDRPANKIAYLDDLGVIVITDSPRRVDQCEKLVKAVLERRAEQKFLRFEVEHISASVARQRVIDLLGGGGGGGGGAPVFQPQPGGEMMVVAGGGAGRLANLPDRLSIDAQGNALIFRGMQDEADEVEAVLAVLDVPNNLETRVYFAGSAASAIADIARSRGLAEIQEVQSAPEETGQPGAALQPGRPIVPQQPMIPGLQGQQSQAPKGGPTMVVDTSRGIILYAGTKAQHEQVAAILKEFDTEQDQIVVKAYQLQHADAQDVADLILSLLMNQAPAAVGSGALLPRQAQFYRGINERREGRTGRSTSRLGSQTGESRFGGGFGTGEQPGAGQREQPGVGAGGGEGDTYVIADPKNNQVLVKAPAKLQPEFARLIEKVDLRRPQVYIEAQIVAVNATKEFRLAFNYQLINAGGTGGILNFQTGLGSFGEDGQITDPIDVNTGLLGVTAALIKSEYVPIIITALQRNVNGRVLSSPQLLIDDNETATLVSVEQQPFSTSQQGNATTESGFGGYEEAGTQLTITPSISQGGYVRMEYQVMLSSFVGNPTVNSESGTVIPPARLQNEVSGDSVTVPGDTTVVVGGVTIDTLNDTIIKVPLLGDIPILGYLFRDTGKSNRKTTLYIFLTPRILREPSIPDLILLTRGPQERVGLEAELPALEPSPIEIFEMRKMEPAPPTERPKGP